MSPVVSPRRCRVAACQRLAVPGWAYCDACRKRLVEAVMRDGPKAGPTA